METDWTATTLTSQRAVKSVSQTGLIGPDGQRRQLAVQNDRQERSGSGPEEYGQTQGVHLKHELFAEHGQRRHRGEESDAATVAAYVGCERRRVAQRAGAGRSRQAGEKDHVRPE